MTSPRKMMHNLERVIHLVTSKNKDDREFGCILLNGYLSNAPTFNEYRTFLNCVWCYDFVHPSYEECERIIKEYYYQGKIDLTEYRRLHGFFIYLKRVGKLT